MERIVLHASPRHLRRKLALNLGVLAIGAGLLALDLVRWLGWALVALGGGYSLVLLRALGEDTRDRSGDQPAGAGPRASAWQGDNRCRLGRLGANVEANTGGRDSLRLILSAILYIVLTSAAVAQTSGRGPDTTINAVMRARVIDGVLQRLDQGYIFPKKVPEMTRAIRERAKRGAYDRITSAQAFADTLTRDLRAVSRDKHLEVAYHSGGILDEPPDAEPPAEERRARAVFARRVNYGFERVERLAGNVGYLEIRSFNFDAASVDSTLAAAMNFLAHTDALIIDVRRNQGGEPAMVAAVCSYLMPANTLINKFYWRPQNRWDEFRTGPVSGRHYGTKRPVYVLTSDQTFSGAEEFAYDVQTQRRGEVVGDTTGGGAHPGGMRQVTEQFGVWVPSGRAVNPVTGTNWEGTGVRPDVPVPAADALHAAHLRALERLLPAAQDAGHRARLQQAIDDLRRPAAAS